MGEWYRCQPTGSQYQAIFPPPTCLVSSKGVVRAISMTTPTLRTRKLFVAKRRDDSSRCKCNGASATVELLQRVSDAALVPVVVVVVVVVVVLAPVPQDPV